MEYVKQFMSEGNVWLKYAIAGAVALIVGYYVYNYFYGGSASKPQLRHEEDDYEDFDNMQEEDEDYQQEDFQDMMEDDTVPHYVDNETVDSLERVD